MSKGVEIGNIVKRSISLSPQVNQWAEEMAAAKGYQNNFSAFLADLIREARGDAIPQTQVAPGAYYSPFVEFENGAP